MCHSFHAHSLRRVVISRNLQSEAVIHIGIIMEITSTARALPVPELETYRQQYLDNRRSAREIVDGLSDGQLNWRPGAGRWSVAECLDHLTITDNLYIPVLTKAIEEGRSRGRLGDGPFHHGFIGKKFISSMEPPPKKKFGAPKSMVPADDPSRHDPRETIAAFMVAGDELVNVLEKAQGVDLQRVKVASFITPLLRLNAATWFASLAAHERRHLWQARKVTEEPGFPKR